MRAAPGRGAPSMALVALLLAGCGGSGGSADGPAAARSPVDPLGGAIPEPAPVVSEGGEPPEPSDHAARPALPSPEEIERLPADGGPDFNRLVHEQSPYLLQHARNPVDWYPWGEEAFEAARREGKLIFLSVGYSTCHWCHVMERESFETQEVADALAEDYVAVKVDREERPDIDQIYMTVTQVLRGQGGWPNSVWLTPEGRPWFAATYLPKERFVGLLEKLGDAWETEREEVEEQARRISAAARRILEGRSDGRAEGPLARSVVDELIRELRSVFDAEYGGFGGAPKFPPHQTLRLLLYEHGRTRDPGVLELVTTTLDGMARGGIRDHVGGGFHRYSTDARWFLPHFEKMLYDNALLLRSYAVAWDQTRTPRYREVAEELAAWALRVMRGRHGAFYSALDADSAGEEGAFYVWRPAELVEVLGPEDAALFSRVYGITPEGNFREEATGERTGASLPHLEASLPVVAEERGLELAALQDRLERILRTLGERRSEREWPHRDDKVLTSWNGAMIGGLARAGGALDVPEYLDAARRAADFLLREARRGERLRRSYRGGEGSGDGYAEDYAFLADGLLELFDVTGEVRWLEEAKRLVEVLLARFRDPEAGGFFYSSDDHERLLARPKDPTDGALPSANGVATLVLVRLAEATGEARYAREARRILEEFQPLIRRAPRATQSLILGLARFLDGAAAELAAPDSHEPGEVRVRDRPVTLILVPTRQEVRPGETLPVTARLEIDAGWHVNSASPAQEFLIPTRLELADRPGVGLAGTDYPPPSEQRLEFSDAPLEVYEGVVSLRASVVVSDAAPAGETPLEFRLRVQPCDARRCLDPRTLRATLPIRVLGTGGER